MNNSRTKIKKPNKIFNWRNKPFIALIACLGLLLIAFLTFFAIIKYINSFDKYVVTLEATPQADCILVLGAGIVDGKPTAALEDRLINAHQLYVAGKSNYILVSGDNHSYNYDETAAMKEYLVNLGIPAEIIIQDHAGFNTYDSMYRARDIFKVNSVLICTNSFHISRSLYIARRLGLEAYGYPTPDKEVYNMPPLYKRERLAKIKAFLDVEILHRKPKFLGEELPINGEGNIKREGEEMGTVKETLANLFNNNTLNILLGALLTFISSLILNKGKSNNDISAKMAEKRMEAYIEIINVLNSMHIFYEFKGNRKIKCNISKSGKRKYKNGRIALSFPEIFLSKEEFFKFKGEIADVQNKNSIWIDEKVYKKIGFIDDYFSQCWHIVQGKSEEEIKIIGIILATEINEMYTDIEYLIKKFLITGNIKNHRFLHFLHIKRELFYKHDYENTILYKEFIRNKGETPLGKMQICNDCESNKNCPLKALKLKN
ncbi:MAG: YdcF family protein [Clostridiales bacterium]|nr:YdcF family protein [Clostridiales bacterium]